MSNTIEFKENTIGDSQKRIMLPFLASYNLEYICSVTDQLASIAKREGLSEEALVALKNNLDATAYYLKIATAYTDFLNQEFENKFGIKSAFTQTQVHKPQPLSNVDASSAVIDTDKLQSLDFIQAACKTNKAIDFKKSVITVAQENITSYSIFGLVHNTDISAFFDLPYKSWENVHIECLVIAMIQAIRQDSAHRETFDWLDNVSYFESINFLKYAQEHDALSIDIPTTT